MYLHHTFEFGLACERKIFATILAQINTKTIQHAVI